MLQLSGTDLNSIPHMSPYIQTTRRRDQENAKLLKKKYFNKQTTAVIPNEFILIYILHRCIHTNKKATANEADLQKTNMGQIKQNEEY